MKKTICEESGKSYQYDNWKNPIEIIASSLGIDESGKSGFFTDQLCDYQPCPRPPQKNAQVVVEIGENARNNYTLEELSAIRT